MNGGSTLYYFGKIGNMNPYNEIELERLDLSDSKDYNLFHSWEEYMINEGFKVSVENIVKDFDLPILRVDRTDKILSFGKSMIGLRYGFISNLFGNKSIHLETDELVSFELIAEEILRDTDVRGIYRYVIK